MKKFLSVLLVFVLLASLVSVAFAAVNGATCPEHDGGEMVKKTEETEWETVSSKFVPDEDGIYYLHLTEVRTVTEKWVCTVNSSHYDIISEYDETRETVQLVGPWMG